MNRIQEVQPPENIVPGLFSLLARMLFTWRAHCAVDSAHQTPVCISPFLYPRSRALARPSSARLPSSLCAPLARRTPSARLTRWLVTLLSAACTTRVRHVHSSSSSIAHFRTRRTASHAASSFSAFIPGRTCASTQFYAHDPSGIHPETKMRRHCAC